MVADVPPSPKRVEIKAFTPSAFDPLGADALMAFARHHSWDTSKWTMPLLVAGVALLGFDADAGSYLGLTAISAGILNYILLNTQSNRQAILRTRPLLSLGRVSYGVYLFHLLVSSFVSAVLTQHGLSALPAKPMLYFLGTVALVATFWIILERPTNRLKRHFPYSRPIKLDIALRPNTDLSGKKQHERAPR